MEHGDSKSESLPISRIPTCKASPGQGRVILGQMAALATSKRAL